MRFLSIVILNIALIICIDHTIANSSDLYFPTVTSKWEIISPKNAGFDSQKLQEAIEYAKKQKSSGVIILYNGRILAEQYWNAKPHWWGQTFYKNFLIEVTPDNRTIEDVASIQKSIISFIAGVAREHGKLDLNRTVSSYLGTGWSKASLSQENKITVRHVMSMSSGLAVSLDFQSPAGSIWKYNTRAYSKMIPILEAATGMSISKLTTDWLTKPTGMFDSRWVSRQWLQDQHDANKIGFATSARDLARFGLLVLANGTWDGHAILKDPKFLHEALKPSQDLNRNYGLLWWLNTKKMYPHAPRDTVFALGAFSQIVAITRSQRLVVVRIGNKAEGNFGRTFMKLLYAAVSN